MKMDALYLLLCYNLCMNETAQIIELVLEQTQQIILGKEEQIKLAFAAYISSSHLLVEDIPGVGKTTLAKTLAHVLGLSYSRVQFTSDLLPADITGVNFYNTKEATFSFKKGPLFSQFLLADEINRASSKTQSALLEAMEESQVSVDGVSYRLPHPFFVMATKNPQEEAGVYELPSSQLDRFALCISLGYPSKEAEFAMLQSLHKPDIASLASLTQTQRDTLSLAYKSVVVSDAIVELVQEILALSRESGLFKTGLSPRSALALVASARAWALLEGRYFVIPSDLLTLLPHIVRHRLKGRVAQLSQSEILNAITQNLHIDT